MTTVSSADNLNTAEYWDGVYRAESEFAGEAPKREYGAIHDAICALVPPRSRVLDVGCGPGILCRKLAERVPRVSVMGVDLSPYVVARNAERDAGLPIRYATLDARTDLAGLEGGWDVVMMCELIEHLDRPEQTLRAAMSLLRDGGLFILTCPHDDEVPDQEHLLRWGHDELFHALAPYSPSVTFRHFAPPFHLWMLAWLEKEPQDETMRAVRAVAAEREGEIRRLHTKIQAYQRDAAKKNEIIARLKERLASLDGKAGG